jgi:hypothetical protein
MLQKLPTLPRARMAKLDLELLGRRILARKEALMGMVEPAE